MPHPIAIASPTKNPFANNQSSQILEREQVVSYQGKSYATTTYSRMHGLVHLIIMKASAIFKAISQIPLMLAKGRHAIKTMWKKSHAGDEKKQVHIAEVSTEHDRSEDKRLREFHESKNPSEEAPEKRAIRKEVIQERKYPPLSTWDTFLKDPVTGKVGSEHGKGQLFQDEEIVERCNIERKEEIGKGTAIDTDHFPSIYETVIFAYYTKYGRPILQQQATRGCTAAATAMLIMDNGKLPDIHKMISRNIGREESQKKDIKDAGLTPLCTRLSRNGFLSELRKNLFIHGAAIVHIDGETGGHSFVVDNVSEKLDSVRLRDPYHGWEITVTSDAFMKRKPSCGIIQTAST